MGWPIYIPSKGRLVVSKCQYQMLSAMYVWHKGWPWFVMMLSAVYVATCDRSIVEQIRSEQEKCIVGVPEVT